MQINLSLCLPRDEVTIPVARHICRHALTDLGVDEDCRSDIEIALTEACANVLKHSNSDEEYEIRVTVENDVCIIRVIDTGMGFDAANPPLLAQADDESGRGIAMMRALVDQVRLESKPEEGTVVHLEKRLGYAEQSVMRKLAARD
ncbi:MAG: serine/threonine-protein kinase RsbW [Acidimicrobiaceae bacterium]|nr:serine/threonine-protein kinase RsbW [Acidimicrobiaceae bacterium]MDQ1445290.1 serine/threonine-protein kinase RsbW [Acidimicrobiaceae bacterium]